MGWWDDVLDAGKWITGQGKNKGDNAPGNSTVDPGQQNGGPPNQGYGGGTNTPTGTTPPNMSMPGQVGHYDNPTVSVSTPLGTAGNNPSPSTITGIHAGAGPTNGAVNLPYFQEDRDKIGGLLNGQSPFAGQDWNGLIKQLQDRASGKNSLAQQNYNLNSQNTVNALSSMSRGSANPDAAREAMIQEGRIGQGQAAGAALAGTQEQMAAQSGLQDAMGTRDKINSLAYQQLLGQQLGLSAEQMKALGMNAGYIRQDNATNAANSAAQNQMIAQLLIAGAKLYGNDG